jgi:hypothetical protein
MLNGVRAKHCLATVTLGGLIACGGSTPTTPTTPPPQNVDACGTIAQTVSGLTAITNGTTCLSNDTSVVRLNMQDAIGNVGSCSGTVIAPRAVLTAAHCLDGGVRSVVVWRGEFPPELIPASSFRAHPEYDSGRVTFLDVGVVLVDRDLGRPIVPLLVSREPQQAETAVVAGWGQDSQQESGLLRAGSMTLSRVEETVLRTQFSTMVGGICRGDSGGPILLSQGGTWAIAGIISATSAPTCNTGEHFYAKVRYDRILSFIRENVSNVTER